MDLGSDQGYSIVQIDQLLMKGSAEISSEFHPELVQEFMRKIIPLRCSYTLGQVLLLCILK